jgi:hypothetical protein
MSQRGQRASFNRDRDLADIGKPGGLASRRELTTSQTSGATKVAFLLLPSYFLILPSSLLLRRRSLRRASGEGRRGHSLDAARVEVPGVSFVYELYDDPVQTSGIS